MNQFELVRPAAAKTKGPFNLDLDNDLQKWIRHIAWENKVTIQETMHQIIRFAQNNYQRSEDDHESNEPSDAARTGVDRKRNRKPVSRSVKKR